MGLCAFHSLPACAWSWWWQGFNPERWLPVIKWGVEHASPHAIFNLLQVACRLAHFIAVSMQHVLRQLAKNQHGCCSLHHSDCASHRCNWRLCTSQWRIVLLQLQVVVTLEQCKIVYFSLPTTLCRCDLTGGEVVECNPPSRGRIWASVTPLVKFGRTCTNGMVCGLDTGALNLVAKHRTTAGSTPISDLARCSSVTPNPVVPCVCGTVGGQGLPCVGGCSRAA